MVIAGKSISKDVVDQAMASAIMKDSSARYRLDTGRSMRWRCKEVFGKVSLTKVVLVRPQHTEHVRVISDIK